MAVNDQPPAMPLRVTRNDKIADGIHLFEFRDAAGQPLPEFSAGAHIAIHVPGGLLRKYSLCNDPAERDRYQVAVKREANGRGGSSNLIDKVKAGDTLMVARAGQRFRLAAARTGFPVHRRRHRHHADHGHDPRGARAEQTLSSVLLHAFAGDDRVPRRAERAGIQGQRHHPLRRRRSRPRRSISSRSSRSEKIANICIAAGRAH